jgi:lysozyme family protein
MAAASYSDAIARLLKSEGGYVNHPSDPGGPTNFGITLADYRKYKMPNATAADVRAMKVSEAKDIYRSKYWDAIRADELPAGVDYCLFDYAVNSGTGRAPKVLQRILAVAVTGHVDNPTVAAANKADAAQTINAICDERMRFLKGLKTWGVFGAGWSRRVGEVRAAALAMARNPAKASAQAAPQSGGKAFAEATPAQIGQASGAPAVAPAVAPAQLPVATAAPSTARDAKEAGGIVAGGGGLTAILYGLWGSWAFKAAFFIVLAAALYWFIVRPILRRVTALDQVECDFVTRMRLALKGIKTKLFAWLLGISGFALPILSYASDVDLSAVLPDIGGIPASTYQYVILAGIGWAINALRNATTTPVGHTDLALAAEAPAPVADTALPVDTTEADQADIGRMVGALQASNRSIAASVRGNRGRRKPKPKAKIRAKAQQSRRTKSRRGKDESRRAPARRRKAA